MSNIERATNLAQVLGISLEEALDFLRFQEEIDAEIMRLADDGGPHHEEAHPC